MDYGKKIQRAFQIIWRHKFIWIFGFLAALGGSGGGGGGGGNAGNSFGNQFSGSPTGQGDELPPWLEDFEEIEGTFETFGQTFMENMGLIITIGVIVILLLLIFRLVMFLIRHIAEAGIIIAVDEIERGTVRTFREIFGSARPYLWPMLGMRLLLFLPAILVWIVFIIIGAAVGISLATSGGDSPGLAGGAIFALVCGGGLFILLTVLYSLVASIIFPIAQRHMIFDGTGVMDSIRTGWNDLRTHTSDFLVSALILWVLMAIGGVLVALVTIPIVLAGALPAIFAFFGGQVPTTGQFILLGVLLFVAQIVGALGMSIIISFRSTFFTLVYHDVHNMIEKAPDADSMPPAEKQPEEKIDEDDLPPA